MKRIECDRIVKPLYLRLKTYADQLEIADKDIACLQAECRRLNDRANQLEGELMVNGIQVPDEPTP